MLTVSKRQRAPGNPLLTVSKPTWFLCLKGLGCIIWVSRGGYANRQQASASPPYSAWTLPKIGSFHADRQQSSASPPGGSGGLLSSASHSQTLAGVQQSSAKGLFCYNINILDSRHFNKINLYQVLKLASKSSIALDFFSMTKRYLNTVTSWYSCPP